MHPPAHLTVVGAGPAGCSAAIAARLAGAGVTLWERSKFPRHKVCGEFLSPEIVPILRMLGVWDRIEQLRPPRYERLALHFSHRTKTAPFDQRPYGFSRYRLDQLLLDRAVDAGARLESASAPGTDREPIVVAHGRRDPAPQSPGRWMGFKSHFRGPVSDTMELFFFDGGYVGVNAVENQATNVCGVAREGLLRTHRFQPDALIANHPALSARLRPLQRAMDWLFAGPLVFGGRWDRAPGQFTYAAGDALGFVDPFTGTGILGAVLTGSLAGLHAASGIPAGEHRETCRRALQRPYAVAAAFRWILATPWAGSLARLISARRMVAWTRPQVDYTPLKSMLCGLK